MLRFSFCRGGLASRVCAMLPRSGPASMRCSVCRVDPGRFHRSNEPAPGTGLQSPETESQNRRYRDLSGRQRPHAPCLNPQKCPQTAGFSSETGKRRFASDCVVGLEGLAKPSQAANSRPERNAFGSATVVAIAVAMVGPMPGMLASR